ncbi:MAG: CvpA family protein [Burkholderiales bacterium]
MTGFDIAVFTVVGVSILLGVMRGLVKEVMALVSWVIAFMVAKQFASAAAVFVPASVAAQPLRVAIGFVVILVAALLVLWVATFLATELLKATGLTTADRMLGAVFGLVRGLFIVVVAVMVAGLTSLPKHPGWRNAWLSPPFEAVAMAAKAWLPESVKANVHFDGD